MISRLCCFRKKNCTNSAAFSLRQVQTCNTILGFGMYLATILSGLGQVHTEKSGLIHNLVRVWVTGAEITVSSSYIAVYICIKIFDVNTGTDYFGYIWLHVSVLTLKPIQWTYCSIFHLFGKCFYSNCDEHILMAMGHQEQLGTQCLSQRHFNM